MVASFVVNHARFSNSEIFRIGEVISGGPGSSQQAIGSSEFIVEPQHHVAQVLQHVTDVSQTTSPQIPQDCGVLFWFGTGSLPAIISEQIEQVEVVYQIDRDAAELTIHFRADLFDPRSAEDWSNALMRIIDQITQTDERSLSKPLGQLDWIDEDLRQTMIQYGQISGPNTESFYSLEASEDFTFHRRFEAQVKRAPDRVAVWAKEHASDATGTQWTYRELNQRANTIARHLIDVGLQKEDSVGIVMQRRVGLLAALLGVMKAGGRYVALEPELPIERLTFMSDDSSVKYLITEEELLERATEINESASILNVDDDRFVEIYQSGADLDKNPKVKVHSQNSCYTIYTSGSTGKPKGVEVCHHSLVNLCYVMVEMLGFGPEDTSAAMSTIAFDASVGELFPLLLVGGRVAIGHKQIGADGKQLSELIESVHPTYMAATPTSLRVLIASGWKNSPDLTVIAGGEAISPMVRDEIMPRIARLVNGYGPTECTVYSTFGILDDSPGPVPLGGPLLNARLYVLDEFGHPVPPMVPGKLFIGGQLPARGYLHRPELTAEKFLNDPFVDPREQPAARMYDSGDVVYWNHDGTLFYIGRSDHQMKLRGYRIEAGEIEAKLKRHPAVRDAIAMVREDEPGAQRLVAYVIYDDRVADSELQSHLLADMPDYMVPTWFVPLERFPTNANEKLDRQALPKPEDVEVSADEGLRDASEDTNQTVQLALGIAEIWTSLLGRKVRIDDHVFRMGADSLKAVQFQARLNDDLGHPVSVGEVFQSPTARSLAAKLTGLEVTQHATARRLPRGSGSRHDIAIVGMAGRFPDAANLDAFWDNLIQGREAIRDFTHEELEAAGVDPATYLQENYVARGPVLPGAYEFEPEFFGITRNDATIVSPQIRLFLKTAWEALEHAGYPTEPEGNRIGVYAGGGLPNYLAPWRHLPERERLQRLVGNGADFLATRASYSLGLTGPSVAVQTACSTSLVAVIQACEALRSGSCELALAGGSSFSWPHAQGYQHGEGLIYSADGHCRAFDSRASGTIFSQGAGAVLLRPLEDAIAAGDSIHAVIRGIGVNNDGNRKGGYAAPSIQGQTDVIRMAIEDSGVSPRDISYVEAHGTGTMIGDPIEIAGLTNAWRPYTQEKQFCAIGSVKTNIGHADSAAGIAGLLKVVLAMKHRKLAPSLHYESANPSIDFEGSPFFVQTQAEDWPGACDTRFAALSAFGMGGTNAHVILAEGQVSSASTSLDTTTGDQASICQVQEPQQVAEPSQGSQTEAETPETLRLIPFSARTDRSLEKLLDRWRNDSSIGELNSLPDVAWTLQHGRKHFCRRAFAIAQSMDEVTGAIAQTLPNPDQSNHAELFMPGVNASRRKVVFLFTGQGAQYSQMAKQVYEREPVFRDTLDQCDQILQSCLEGGLVSWLMNDQPQYDINETQFAQVALFSVTYSQAKLWQSWGINPSAMIGHSIGEYVAATIAGVMSLEDALTTVALRGKLMQSMPSGSMLAVMHGDRPIDSLLESSTSLDLAVVNTHRAAVVSGPDWAIEAFAKTLEDQGISSKKLVTSHAFHSSMMEPILDSFAEHVRGISLGEPKIPYLSNVTGTWITAQQTTDPTYYPTQLRSTVRFAENLATLVEDDAEDILALEMGPGNTLTRLALAQWAGSGHTAVATLPSASQGSLDSHRFVRTAIGKSWAAGLDVEWAKIEPPPATPKRIALPLYQFDEQTYRAEPERIGSSEPPTDQGWFNVPTWKQAHLASHQQASSRTDLMPISKPLWLWLGAPGDLADSLFKAQFEDVPNAQMVVVSAGSTYQPSDDLRFSLRPDKPEDFDRLFDQLEPLGDIVGIVHAWTIGASTLGDGKQSDPFPIPQSFWQENNRASIGLTWLAKTLGERVYDRTVALTVLSEGIGNLAPSVTPMPANHGLLGAASVIQKEYPAIATKVLDVSGNLGRLTKDRTFHQLVHSTIHEPLLAYAMGRWWKTTFEQVDLSEQKPHITDGGVYVFTGGLGGLARNMAAQLANQFSDLKIGLIVRTEFPPPSQWDALLRVEDSAKAETINPQIEEQRQRIADLRSLQSLCEVRIYQADVSDPAQLDAAFNNIHRDFGNIDGVFHAAGVLRDGVIATKKPESLETVFASKALAARLVCETLAKQKITPKFIAFFSSIASDLCLLGQVDYSAANNYLDGLCAQINTPPDSNPPSGPASSLATMFGFDAISINWPAFRDVGMAARSQTGLSEDAALKKEILQNSFSIAEGTRALIDVINSGEHPRVTISKMPFAQRQMIAIEDARSVTFTSSTQSTSANTDDDKPATGKMLDVWRELFGSPDIGLDDDYFQMGGDSLLAIGMVTGIEKGFGVQIPISHLISNPTPRKLLSKMGLSETDRQGVNAQPSGDIIPTKEVSIPSHIIQLREGESERPPLFLIHGADGAVMFYHKFAQRLTTDRGVYAIESPFLQDLDYEIPDSVEEIASNYAQDLRKVQPQGPYLIAGYSFGGVLAFELARQLRDAGEELEMLILYDIPNPETLQHNSAIDRLKQFWSQQENELVLTKSLKLTKRIGQAVRDRTAVEIENRLAASKAKNEEAGGFWRHKKARERHMAIEENYRPQRFDGPLRITVATGNSSKFRTDETLGWSTVSSDLSIIKVPGSHLELFDDPYLENMVTATETFVSSIDSRPGSNDTQPGGANTSS